MVQTDYTQRAEEKFFEKLFAYGDANVQLLPRFYHLCEVNLWERARRA